MDYPPDATVNDLDGTPLTGDRTGRWFMLQCNDELIRVVYVRPGTPAEMADEARRYLPLPVPRPQFAPSRGAAQGHRRRPTERRPRGPTSIYQELNVSIRYHTDGRLHVKAGPSACTN
ncbi:MAG: hypothetical protein ABI658_21180 [Acidimicrobiales bacterium]